VLGMGVLAAGRARAQGPAASNASGPDLSDAMRRPLPEQRPVSTGVAQLGDAGLAYWDTGAPAGNPGAQTIILLHPSTGSHACWGYQQPVFAEAGYRVIGYSRRSHLGSPSISAEDGTGAGDLLKLADHLGVERFHAVGLAAGAIVAVDFALSHPGRLQSAVFACTHMGIRDADYLTMSNGLRPKGFAEMPSEFREVGPSYRAANPAGVAQWVALEHGSRAAGRRVPLGYENDITWAALRQLQVRALLMGGDADLWAPPSVVRMFAAGVPGSEMAIVPEAGHSAYWEQPEIFNRTVLAFLGRQG
jgi:pimeloyl-ACP methyl ester carboxylesterase